MCIRVWSVQLKVLGDIRRLFLQIRNSWGQDDIRRKYRDQWCKRQTTRGSILSQLKAKGLNYGCFCTLENPGLFYKEVEVQGPVWKIF